MLGAGGMGEVYRATDAKLKRQVALKVLPEAVTADPHRLGRFQREAEVLASLNHPHIAQIYGLEESGAVRALVMELVEGATLADRIATGPMSLAETVTIGDQLIDALDAAHEKGIIHRDLKPGNIMITPDGVVKVLDFGLAKIESSSTQGWPIGDTPTVTAGSRHGVILGTAAYMSPEQARGRPVDKRTDIWAFGCVLYESLTGRAAFAGESVADTLAAIVERAPDWAALPPQTVALRPLLERCLQKDVRKRLRDIADARSDLERASTGTSSEFVMRRSGSRTPWMLASLCVALAVTAAIGWLRAPDNPAEAAWSRGGAAFSVALDPGATLAESLPAVSPDGDVAWVVTPQEGKPQIWLRSRQTGVARPLPGTEEAQVPFWSGDGGSIAFSAGGKLNRIDLDSGAVTVIGGASAVYGGTWSADDIIVLSTRLQILRTTAGGAAPIEVAALNPALQENSLRYPVFLPDGRHFLYVARSGRPKQSGVYVGSLDGPPKRLFSTTTSVAYANGYLLYGLGGRLVARTFNPNTLTVGEEVKTVATNLAANVSGMDGNFAVSNGVLAYYEGRGDPLRELWWVDREGRPLGNAPVAAGAIDTFRLSRDGSLVVYDRINSQTGSRAVWLQGVTGGAPERVTNEESDDWMPILSHDKQRIAFMTYRNGIGDIFGKTLQGTGADETLIVSSDQKVPIDWSPDGRFLVYNQGKAVFALPVERGSDPIPIATGRGGRISPDGDFIVYESDETGAWEVWVVPFPNGRRFRVTNGVDPAWSARGSELIFRRGRALMSVAVRASASGVSVGPLEHLFDLPDGRPFEPAPDGSRILVARPIAHERRLQVVLNWPARLTSTPRR